MKVCPNCSAPILTAAQAKVFHRVKVRVRMSSRALAFSLGCSVASAGQRLNALVVAGLLIRTRLAQSSGGFEYIYQLRGKG